VIMFPWACTRSDMLLHHPLGQCLASQSPGGKSLVPNAVQRPGTSRECSSVQEEADCWRQYEQQRVAGEMGRKRGRSSEEDRAPSRSRSQPRGTSSPAHERVPFAGRWAQEGMDDGGMEAQARKRARSRSPGSSADPHGASLRFMMVSVESRTDQPSGCHRCHG
jgi:hypothetical protein